MRNHDRDRRFPALLVSGILVGASLVSCSGAETADSPEPTFAFTTPPTENSTSTAPGAKSNLPADSDCETDAAPGRTDQTIVSGSDTRGYVQYLPTPTPTADSPAPLVIDFTAYSPASTEEGFSGLTKPNSEGVVKADEVGAVVLTPEPVNGEGLLTWNISNTAGWTDDQQFIEDLLDAVESDLCIPTDRVLITGFALGAVMASTIACELADRIDAVAVVSGLWDPPGCAPTESTPILTFHGTDDHFLPFDGGVGDGAGGLGLSSETSDGLTEMATRPGVIPTAQSWAARFGSVEPPTRTPVVDGVKKLAWNDGTAPIELYEIDGGGHTWPGTNGMAYIDLFLGPVSLAIDANDIIWDFFERNAD